MTVLQLGHGTLIDIDPDGGPILLVAGDRCEPLSLRLPSGPSLPVAQQPKAEPARKFKKIRYAGAE
jgi:hypothetical protein